MNREFFWAVLRLQHSNCPFIGISKTFEALVRPTFFDLYKTSIESTEALDVCLYVDTYIPPLAFKEMAATSISDTFKLVDFEANAAENRTIIIGTVKDRAINEVVGELKSIPIMYARENYEYIVVKALIDYKSWKELVEKLEAKVSAVGDVEITKMGKVKNVEEFRTLRLESQYVDKPLRALSTEENILLSQVIATGYYEQPRRVNLDKLSEILGMKKSTLNMKLRRIEEKLLVNASDRSMIR